MNNLGVTDIRLHQSSPPLSSIHLLLNPRRVQGLKHTKSDLHSLLISATKRKTGKRSIIKQFFFGKLTFICSITG